MKISFSFLFLLFLMSCSNSNQNSLHFSEQQNNVKFSRYDSIYKLSKNKKLSYQKRIEYINYLIKSADSLQNDSLWFKYSSYKTALYGNQQQFDSAIFFANILYDKAVKKK